MAENSLRQMHTKNMPKPRNRIRRVTLYLYVLGKFLASRKLFSYLMSATLDKIDQSRDDNGSNRRRRVSLREVLANPRVLGGRTGSESRTANYTVGDEDEKAKIEVQARHTHIVRRISSLNFTVNLDSFGSIYYSTKTL